MNIAMEKVGEFPDFKAYFNAFPELSARLLGYMGKQSALELQGMMERGENDLTFRDMDSNRKSSGGRRMITYSIGRGLKWVAVSSFPLNLYERRRQLRSGDAARKGILTRKLPGNISSRMSSYIIDAEKYIVDDWFNNKAKGGLKHI